MSFAEMFLRIEPVLRQWEDLAAEHGPLDVIRVPAIPPDETRCVAGQDVAIYHADQRPIPLKEHRKPTRLFVGRHCMTLIVDAARPGSVVVSYDGVSFNVAWLKVVYVPWMDAEAWIVGSDLDQPERPAALSSKLVDMAEARRRYDHG